MPSNGLIAILPIQAGKEEQFKRALHQVRGALSRTEGETIVPDALGLAFHLSQRIHFARLTLLPPAGGPPDRIRLLLATDYDGSLEEHVSELHSLARPADEFWGCCEGYHGPESFLELIQRHTVSPGAYYIAFRGREVEELRDYARLRKEYEGLLSQPNALSLFPYFPEQRTLVLTLKRILEVVSFPLDLFTRFAGSLPAVVRVIRDSGFALFLTAGKQINQTLDRVPWIRFFNWITRNPAAYEGPGPSSPGPPFSEALPEAEAPPPAHSTSFENAILQNQLTLVTDVPPNDVPRLKAVLALIDLYGRHLSPPGTLVGISTIHTVRWALIDEDRRLLMVSNYDGSWENYIDEFAELILSGLNALWRSAPGYPRAGAGDVVALKQFLRRHQVHASVFYSAYPGSSVLSLKSDVDFSKWFGWLVKPRLRSTPRAAWTHSRPAS